MGPVLVFAGLNLADTALTVAIMVILLNLEQSEKLSCRRILRVANIGMICIVGVNALCLGTYFYGRMIGV